MTRHDPAQRPAVSIVLYVHDAAAYLGDLLASVFDQTFRDFELCVVDDGSTDDTAAILAALDDPRVRVSTTSGNGRASVRITVPDCL